MNSVTPHPSPEILLRWMDDDLAPPETARVGEHLRGCGDCREQVQALRDALSDYDRFHRDILKPSLPPAPRPWSAIEFPRPSVRRFKPVPWLVAAAAFAALAFIAIRFEYAPEVRAARLLRKAIAAEEAQPAPHGRIRIRSRSRSLDRPARLILTAAPPETRDSAALQALFIAGGYSWDDPLSAQAFLRWRDALPSKHDQVEQQGADVLVRTSADEGAVSDAALTLRARDLHAVACVLRFRSSGEEIDITEVPDRTPPAGAPTLLAPPAPPVRPEEAPAGPADELRVLAALHRIGADLGEPIDVERHGALVGIRVTGLDQHRRDQIRAALSGIAAAKLTFEEVRSGDTPAALPPSHAPIAADRANPLIADLRADLRAHLGDGLPATDLSDELIDATDRAAERAFALRALARRFPPREASQLSRSDGASLSGMAKDHAAALAIAIQELERLLAPILPNSGAPPAPGPVNWQSVAEALPPEVDQLDRTLNGAADATATRKTQLAETIRRLDRQIAALQNLLP
jgi:hypothetical protein